MNPLAKYIPLYEKELRGSVIPFWEKNCLDRECGGYFTCLDRDGSVYDTEKYMWMQWRIVCMFAILGYNCTGDRRFLDWFEKLQDWTWPRFPDPDYGDWFAYLNRRGEPTHRLKGGKWKTFFHVPRYLFIALGEMERDVWIS